ncbi:MAG: alpha/beta hydrolase [Planctomycetota bacterium]
MQLGLGLLGLALRITGAAWRTSESRLLILPGWIVATLGTWLIGAAMGAWSPLWLPAAVASVGACIQFRTGPRAGLWPVFDASLVIAAAAISIPAPSLIALGTALALATSAGMLADAALSKTNQRRRAIVGTVVFVGSIATLAMDAQVRKLLPNIAKPSTILAGPFSFPDGERIELKNQAVAWLDTPGGSGTRPGVLFFHGSRPNGAHSTSAAVIRRAFVDAGAIVLAVDHPGFGASGCPEMEAPAAAWDPKETQLAALRYLRGREGVGPVFVAGHSLGGTDTLRVLAEWPGIAGVVFIGAGVIEPVDSMPADRQEFWWARFSQRRGLPRRLERKKFFEIWRRFYDTMAFMDRYAKVADAMPPALFVLAQYDPRGTYDESDRLQERWSGSKQRWILHGAGHDIASTAFLRGVWADYHVARRLSTKLREFLDSAK